MTHLGGLVCHCEGMLKQMFCQSLSELTLQEEGVQKRFHQTQQNRDICNRVKQEVYVSESGRPNPRASTVFKYHSDQGIMSSATHIPALL